MSDAPDVNEPSPASSPHRPTRLERAQANLDHWREEAASVERERKNMIWIPRVGVPVGIIVAVFVHGWIGVGACVLALFAWALGIYMSFVRRAEFAHHVRHAEAEVATSRANRS